MATAAAATSAEDSGIGRKGVTAFWVIAFIAIFIVESLVLLYAAIAVWPDTSLDPPSMSNFQVFNQSVTMTRDQNLLLVMAILGGVGAMGHVLRSFFKYVGQRNLIWSWMPQYVLIPVLGATLATISYILLKAGLIGGNTAAGAEGNVWGFASVATLVGLFTAQAAAKLKDIFEVVLAPSAPGSDRLATNTQATISFTPKEGPVGSTVAITGDGLEAATAVQFGGGVDSTFVWLGASNALQATVPTNAVNGPLRVTLPSGVVTSTDEFTVTS